MWDGVHEDLNVPFTLSPILTDDVFISLCLYFQPYDETLCFPWGLPAGRCRVGSVLSLFHLKLKVQSPPEGSVGTRGCCPTAAAAAQHVRTQIDVLMLSGCCPEEGRLHRQPVHQLPTGRPAGHANGPKSTTSYPQNNLYLVSTVWIHIINWNRSPHQTILVTRFSWWIHRWKNK